MVRTGTKLESGLAFTGCSTNGVASDGDISKADVYPGRVPRTAPSATACTVLMVLLLPSPSSKCGEVGETTAGVKADEGDNGDGGDNSGDLWW